jgi:hypothetical protein
MTTDFETLMTLGPCAEVRLDQHIECEDFERELPRPEGEGWMLKFILPIHNNPRFIQYFWERRVEDEDDDSSGPANFKDPSFNLAG